MNEEARPRPDWERKPRFTHLLSSKFLFGRMPDVCVKFHKAMRRSSRVGLPKSPTLQSVGRIHFKRSGRQSIDKTDSEKRLHSISFALKGIGAETTSQSVVVNFLPCGSF